MAAYRAVCRHVRYWRGQLHKWSTVYPFVGTLASANYNAMIGHLHDMERSVCYADGSEVAGGLWEIALYNQATGGVPVLVVNYFDPLSTATWIEYSGDAWTSPGQQLVSAAEVALQVEWPAGLSSSGKPVRYRKWYHAVPNNPSTPPAPDVNATNVSGITSAIEAGMTAISGLGINLGSGSRLAATTPIVVPFYGNHQMPRGRRRKPATVSTSSLRFPTSLLVVPGNDGSLSS